MIFVASISGSLNLIKVANCFKEHAVQVNYVC